VDHEIHRVVSFEKVAPFTLRVDFQDGISQIIDFRPILNGELYGPLQNSSLFDRVRIDSERSTRMSGQTAPILIPRPFTIGQTSPPP
jgi:Protein of unknown function (DUF2442)